MEIKILVTGANGMLGSSLCQLYEKGKEVYALHRDSVCYVPCRAHFSLDLANEEGLKKVFQQIKPELVIHCAGLTDVDKCEKNPELAHDANVLSTEHVARLCGDQTKLVYISTDQVYGDAGDHSEANDNLKPANIYGKTKLQGECKVREFCADHMIIRTNIFGWNVKPGKTGSAEWMYHSLKNKQGIILFDDYFFSPVFTKSLGEIIMQLVQMNFSGIINAGSPEPCSKYEFGMLLSEAFGLDKSLISRGSVTRHAFDAPRPHDLTLKVNKLIDLGISLPDYKTSMMRFHEDNLKLKKVR
jgi:dTDP-4-dehydrorhamnose reductase